jgi:2-C-methyl-D-erythritol 4-phosphate cytidylyltransferase
VTRVGVAVPAAGSGRRMGGVRKPFLELLDEPVLLHALRPFLAERRVAHVVVALSAPDAVDPPDWLADLDERVRIVEGGETRWASVRRALEAIPGDVDVIAVHDAARPLVTPETVSACIDVAEAGAGAVAGCPAVDTMKTVDASGDVVATPDRTRLWHAHTPQVFPARVLREAYASSTEAATDDAALVEGHGIRIRMVDDGGLNLKVTRPDDAAVAESILRHRRAS